MSELLKEVKVGDLIPCNGARDMISRMSDLHEAGYITDFVYEVDGKEGYWLKVTDVEETFVKKWSGV